jgi:hypothetical protein
MAVERSGKRTVAEAQEAYASLVTCTDRLARFVRDVSHAAVVTQDRSLATGVG